MGSRRWHRSPDGASPNSSPSLPPSPSIAPPSAGRSGFGLLARAPGEPGMPVVALARALFAIIPKRGAWARGSCCDRSRRLLQAEPLKCQRLVGSGRQTATACRLHPAHFGFLGKASGSRLPFLSHADTNGSWRSTVANRPCGTKRRLFGVGSPHRACARRGHGKELPRKPDALRPEGRICMRAALVA